LFDPVTASNYLAKHYSWSENTMRGLGKLNHSWLRREVLKKFNNPTADWPFLKQKVKFQNIGDHCNTVYIQLQATIASQNDFKERKLIQLFQRGTLCLESGRLL
jgi:hypothetical protein